ncbi:MAG: hypothetical protein IT532_00305 [Burkholderiales bacterium]|nr:hypothetical protein [Burkholderiales bacterium]
MAALSADRGTPKRDAAQFSFPQATNTVIYAGALVMLNASGYATPGATATGQKCVGVAEARSNNNPGANGAQSVRVRRGCFRFANSASGDAIALADVGADCYIVDDQTVAKTNGSSTRSICGKVRDVDADGVWVEI